MWYYYFSILVVSLELRLDLEKKPQWKQFKRYVPCSQWSWIRCLLFGKCDSDMVSWWADPSVCAGWVLKEAPPAVCHGRPSPIQGQRRLQWAVVVWKGAAGIWKFCLYLLFDNDLNSPRCQTTSRKKLKLGFCYQLGELRLFFSLTPPSPFLSL